MTDTQKALKVPLTVKGKKLVSCNAVPGRKPTKSDLRLKRASKTFDRNHAAVVKWGMDKRRPYLVLTDVLKTKIGRSFLDKQETSMSSEKAQTASEKSPCQKEHVKCGSQKEPKNDREKIATPKYVQKSTLTSQRRPYQKKRLHHVDNGEESKDIEQMVIVNTNGEDYGVVDCGLSVSWKPSEDAGDTDEFSPTSIKDIKAQEKHCLKRKRKAFRLVKRNGTCNPKRQRESVLRLTSESGLDPGLSPRSLIDPEEDCDLGDVADSRVVRPTVGAICEVPRLVPVANSNRESGEVIRSHASSRLPPQDSDQASPGELIVLSSDDEESGNVTRHRVRCVNTVSSLRNREAEHRLQQSSLESVSKEPDGSHLQNVEVLHVVVGTPASVSPPPKIDHYFLGLHFTYMICGGCQGQANGKLTIVNQKIMIPLKDLCQELDVTLTLERSALRRYSIWEQDEVESRGICSVEPCTFLFFCITQSAAIKVQRDLLCLSTQQGQLPVIENPSPFLVVALKEPLQGMDGAVLRSLLEIDCHDGLTKDKNLDLEDFPNPSLSLDESLELIKSSGRDPLMLRWLGLDATVSVSEPDQQFSCSDSDVDELNQTAPDAELSMLLDMTSLQTLAEMEQGKVSKQELEQEEEPEDDTGMQHLAEEDQKAQEEDNQTGSPLYTLCRRRTSGSYTVTMCQPDSTWVKFKRQGLAQRLIQFPPPPLKGGITVTMEDLLCLDHGQYLNDVIIDFYLKYLLQNSSRAVVERSHIFSSFFYKQLTRRDNASEGTATESCQRQKRHQRVKNWTRHVDIFTKDFLFVPVNQEAHWYLVVICFPGLKEPKLEPWKENSHNGISESPEQDQPEGSGNSNDANLIHCNSADMLSGNEPKASLSKVDCTEKTCNRNFVSKTPCILIMDSLKLSLHERIFKLLREYLQSEWEARRGSSRDFGPDQMKSSHCQVPLQDNSSDCGLYLLQYVESFLKDPVVHFELPLHLHRWFQRRQVRSKRDEIRDLVLQIYRQQKMSKK
ncbi:sentrin-specific protease 7 [Corythoichthys intestinalis]|uniref:sentrin-specific protease 7 n=1 Tax=Corythoichthys intestinalis TaxID=161448 RepID=UPI0025A60FD3|nr:sentrin-specific protease 7 [Corythoichthys intestinalis]